MMNKRFLLSGLFALGTLLDISRLAAAAAPSRPDPVHLDQLDLTARETTFDGSVHRYRITGSVHAVVRDLDVRCDQADIFLSTDDDEVLKMEFSGGVVARRGKNVFKSARINYWVPERRLVAQGGTRTILTLPVASRSVR
jgi:lipopolysaccharide export system protein LptA